MLKLKNSINRRMLSLVAALVLVACGANSGQAPAIAGGGDVKVHKISSSAENSGFLKLDYAKLTPNSRVEGNVLSYSNPEQLKRLRSYLAVTVDPVQIYVATDAAELNLPENGPKSIAEYFERALKNAVAPVYPLVDDPGSLVLSLRAAVVGVAEGGSEAVSVDKAIIEIELVDSETGEVIGAIVDKETLGAGALAGGENLSREEKFRAAADAFDEWAMRVREFLEVEHEIEGTADEQRTRESFQPYGT